MSLSPPRGKACRRSLPCALATSFARCWHQVRLRPCCMGLPLLLASPCRVGMPTWHLCLRCLKTVQAHHAGPHKLDARAAYGTYVLAATDMTCRVKELEEEVVVFNPKKEVIALVAITWAFQIVTLCGPIHVPAMLSHPMFALCTVRKRMRRTLAFCSPQLLFYPPSMVYRACMGVMWPQNCKYGNHDEFLSYG